MVRADQLDPKPYSLGEDIHLSRDQAKSVAELLGYDQASGLVNGCLHTIRLPFRWFRVWGQPDRGSPDVAGQRVAVSKGECRCRLAPCDIWRSCWPLWSECSLAVSYTHLTLPTNREV